MKKQIIILIVIIISSINVYSQSNINEKDAVNTMVEQKNAWNNGDLKSYMDGYWNSDSLIFVGKNGPEYGWNTTYQNYKKSFPDKSSMGHLDFTFINVKTISDSTVSIIGKWELTLLDKNRGGYFTCILKLFNGKWKVIIDHTS